MKKYKIVKKREIKNEEYEPHLIEYWLIKEKRLLFWTNIFYDDGNFLIINTFNTKNDAREYLKKLKYLNKIMGD